MRGGRGESAVLGGRGSVMLGMRPPDPLRQQVSQQAPQSPSLFLIVNAQVRYLPGDCWLLLQDRALLCRKCDVAIHTANSYVSSHQRFLLTGVKVGLEATEPCISSSTKEMLNSSESASSRSIPTSVGDPFGTGEIKDTFPGGIGTLVSEKVPLNRSTTTSAGTILGWQLEEYLGSTNPNQNYGGLDTMPSKVYGSYCDV